MHKLTSVTLALFAVIAFSVVIALQYRQMHPAESVQGVNAPGPLEAKTKPSITKEARNHLDLAAELERKGEASLPAKEAGRMANEGWDLKVRNGNHNDAIRRVSVARKDLEAISKRQKYLTGAVEEYAQALKTDPDSLDEVNNRVEKLLPQLLLTLRALHRIAHDMGDFWRSMGESDCGPAKLHDTVEEAARKARGLVPHNQEAALLYYEIRSDTSALPSCPNPDP